LLTVDFGWIDFSEPLEGAWWIALFCLALRELSPCAPPLTVPTSTDELPSCAWAAWACSAAATISRLPVTECLNCDMTTFSLEKVVFIGSSCDVCFAQS
jgi:hypothetical protein